jgi:hypothetical protein
MKNILLEAYEKLPEFAPATRLSDVARVHRNIYVTEAIDNEKIDILVDKEFNELKLRVDGKGRGVEWKFWKDHFNTMSASTQLLSNLPFDRAIVRCVSNRNPTFLKVLGVISVDAISKKTRWIPFQMVDIFCKATGMSPMPTIFKGPLNIPQIKSLVDRPVLGVKRAGIYVIPDGTPTEYIFLPVNVDDRDIDPDKPGDSRVMHALAEEFAMRAFDESLAKKGASANEPVDGFIKERLVMASESLLLMEYVDRAEKEAGVKVEIANTHLKEAVVNRAKKLWEQYS